MIGHPYLCTQHAATDNVELDNPLFFSSYGNDKIRTCEAVTPTDFPGLRLNPLGHVS